MASGMGIMAVSLVNPATSFLIDCRGRRVTGIYVPALGTATTVQIKGSFDNGNTVAPMYDANASQTFGQIASSGGGFWIDGDILARFYGVPYLVVTLGAAQAGTVTFWVAQGIS